MSIAMNCPRCGRSFTVPDNLAGRQANCPCGQRLEIPMPGPGPVTSPPPPAVQRSDDWSALRNPQSADDLKRMCEQVEIPFRTLDSGACLFEIPSEHKPLPVIVISKISQNGKWVAVYATALEKVSHPSYGLLRKLMELNEALWQGKFSIASSGNIDFQYECPTETLDVQELRACVLGCSSVIDQNYQELRQLV